MSVHTLPNQEPATFTEYVAANVRALMGRRSVSGVRLAGVMGISQSQVSKRLRGLIPFDTEDIGKLAAFFEVDTSVITGGWFGPSGPGVRARRDSNPQPSDPKVRVLSPKRVQHQRRAHAA